MINFEYLPLVTIVLVIILICIYIFDNFVIKDKIFELGALNKDAICVKHEYWRLATASLIHKDFYHIVVNVLAMYLAGWLIEPRIGSIGLIVTFFIANIFTNFVFLNKFTFESSVGASAGIYALVAIILLLCYIDNNFMNLHINTWTLNTLIIYSILGNFKGVDTLFVHHIGFVSGLLLGLLWILL